MQGYAEGVLLTSPLARSQTLLPVGFESRTGHVSQGSQTSAFATMLADSLKPPDPVHEERPQAPESLNGTDTRFEHEYEADVDESVQRTPEQVDAREEQAIEDARRFEEEERKRQRVPMFGEQAPVPDALALARKEPVKEATGEIPPFLREVARLVRTLKTMAQESGEGAQTDPGTKRADDALKGMQALLDLLRGVLPKKEMEAIEKAPVALETALKEGRGGKGPTQPGAVAKQVEDFLKQLPALQDLVAEVSKQVKDARKSEGVTEKKPKGALQAGGADLRSIEDGIRMRLDVKDQRVNDPHALRETVRIVKRQSVEGEAVQKSGEKAAPIPPPENGGLPPVKAPSSGREASTFQQDLGSRMTQSVKKTSATETLSNPRQVVEQIVSRARVTVKSGMTEMHLQLNPRNMGRVGMHFTVNQDGELTAKLMASNESVRQYLQENISTFSRDLADAGVVVTRIEVSADAPGRQFPQEGRSGRDGTEHRDGAVSVTVRQEPRTIPGGYPLQAGSEGNLDVLA